MPNKFKVVPLTVEQLPPYHNFWLLLPSMPIIEHFGIMRAFLYTTIALLLQFCTAQSCSFTILNNCQQTLWPATLAGAGTAQLPVTGLRLDPGYSVKIPAPSGWSGRIWARTGCSFDEKGMGTCKTGNCAGRMDCNGTGAQPPATLFEVTLGSGENYDFYDVSIVDGYNLPVVAAPMGLAGGHCNATGCVLDLNSGCPRELQLEKDGGGEVMACKSACEAFRLDQYCCTGEFDTPSSCRPSFYSSIFKEACPRAYSYAFDDGTGTFTCKAREYAIIFCPTLARSNNSNGLSYGDAFHDYGYVGQAEERSYSEKATVNYYYALLLLLCQIIG